MVLFFAQKSRLGLLQVGFVDDSAHNSLQLKKIIFNPNLPISEEMYMCFNTKWNQSDRKTVQHDFFHFYVQSYKQSKQIKQNRNEIRCREQTCVARGQRGRGRGWNMKGIKRYKLPTLK